MKLLFSPVSENFSYLTNAIRSQLFPRTFVTIVQWIGVEGLRVIQTEPEFPIWFDNSTCAKIFLDSVAKKR